MARIEGPPQNNKEDANCCNLIRKGPGGVETEYLHFNPSQEIPSYQEILETGKPIPSPLLRDLITKACSYLIDQPGPNREFRAEFAYLWLEPWLKILNTIYHYQDNEFAEQKIKKSLGEIKNALRKNSEKSSGLLLMGGGEGTPAHIHAVKWIKYHAKQVVLLFEPSEYIERKARGGEFLPLAMRLSMWAYHPDTAYIGLIPPNSKRLAPNDFYQKIHNQTGAKYHFATHGEPHLEEKIKRGKKASFCIIPRLNSPSTTDGVERAIPGLINNHNAIVANPKLHPNPYLAVFFEDPIDNLLASGDIFNRQ